MFKSSSDKNESLNFQTRAEDLVSKMTLIEKVSQLTYNSPAIKRLNIPAYNWWNEALHGVARAGTATVFPQAIGMAATFDEEIINNVADIISTEGRAKYNEAQKHDDHDIYKGLTFWSPNINIFRDPRWGRGHETYGEDPYLTGKLGVAFIKGIQGNDKNYLKAAACAKHFAVHSGPEAERHNFNAIVSSKDLWETYLPAFKQCLTEGEVEAFMGAYNRVNGEPCCGSKTLLVDILRGKWGFKGHVTSDCWAIKDFHEGHDVTHNALESAALAINNGCDLNCGNMYLNLLLAHDEGMVSEETIDKSVIRLLTTRFKLGMFDPLENVPYSNIPYEEVASRAHREFAIEVSEKAMVLLKNKNNLLPLDEKKIDTIAVIGPNSNSRAALIGNYYGTPVKYVTILEGIQDYVSKDTRVYYSEGCHLYKDKVENLALPKDRFAEAVAIAEKSQVVIMCLGLDSSIEGEEGDVSNEYASGDKASLQLPKIQQELLEAVFKTGKPIILMLLSGSALTVTWADEHVPAIVQAWYPGAEGGRAVASLIFGGFSPSGKLPITFYKTMEELPDFHDYSMENRTYRYMENEALYPFGFGLSYSCFVYSHLEISKSIIEVGDNIEIKVLIKNTGDYIAMETAQLYLKDVEASVVVPRWQLKGIKRLLLKPGEEKVARFSLTPRHMSLIDNEGQCLLEPGIFKFYIGGSQPDKRSIELSGVVPLEGTFVVNGKTIMTEY